MSIHECGHPIKNKGVYWSWKIQHCYCSLKQKPVPTKLAFKISQYFCCQKQNYHKAMAVTVRAFFFFAFVSTTLQFSHLISAVDFNYPAVFNFGDSNSDTGELVAGKGLHLDLPNGVTYFQKPSGRFCDGRLIIDFLSNISTMLQFWGLVLQSAKHPWF